MSMISGLIDELRKVAEYYDGSEVASIMRYAADTIWQLRDDLQRTNKVLMDVEHDESMAWDRVCKAEAEAERLREQIVRCRDCKHSTKGGTLCRFFASWVPIAGGDEYKDMPADVEPDGFCKWGERRADA